MVETTERNNEEEENNETKIDLLAKHMMYFQYFLLICFTLCFIFPLWKPTESEVYKDARVYIECI